MGGRQVTNILLAVIAAVLLFGSAATLGALKWVFAILLALGAIWAIFIAFLWIVERVAEAFREAKQKGYAEVAFVAGALVALCSILVRAIAAGVDGGDGVESPLAATIETWSGNVALATTALICVCVPLVIVYRRRAEVPPFLRRVGKSLLLVPFSMFFYTRDGWRTSVQAGEGTFLRFVSAATGFLMGLVATTLFCLGIFVGILELQRAL